MSTVTGTGWRTVLTSDRRIVTIESIVLLAALWQVAASVFGMQAVISSPLAIIAFTGDLLVSLRWVPHATVTLFRILVAFLLGMTIGIVVALILGFTEFWEAVVKDFVVTWLSMPTLLAVLFAAMWFGTGELTPIAAGVVVAMPYNAQIIYEGVKDVDRDLIRMAQSFDVSRTRVAYRIVFKSVLPETFSAARLAFAGSWQVVALAEYVVSQRGLGFMVRDQLAATSMTGLIGWTAVFVAFIVFIEYGVFAYLERRAFEYRSDVAATVARA